jgi:uncharacterized protein (DUF433 family)
MAIDFANLEEEDIKHILTFSCNFDYLTEKDIEQIIGYRCDNDDLGIQQY